MTMSGSNHTVPSAPLDLTNKRRERVSCSQGTTGDRGRSTHTLERQAGNCSDGQKSDKPRDSCNGSSSLLLSDPTKGAYVMGNRILEDTFKIKGKNPTDPTGKSADSSFSKLPIRKRPFPIEHEPSGPIHSRVEPHHEVKEERCSPAPEVSKYSKGDHLVTDAQKTSNEVPDRPNVRNTQFVQHFPAYFIPGCSYYPWATSYISPQTPVAVQGPALSSHSTLESADLQLADVAAATHQDEDGDTPLHIAVVKENDSLVIWLIEIFRRAHKDLDIFNNLRQTPLHLAVITHQSSLVKALLDAGADPGALDRNGQTALHLCCEHGEADCLTVILRHYSQNPSPHLEFRNYEGLTPLHLAVQNRDKKLTTILLDSGAEINAGDNKSGRSPLMHAVENDSIDMVSFLIESGCDVNAQSYSGNTALHTACGRGQVEVVRVLLKNGADSSLKNNHNDTAIMVAKNKKVSDVLRGKGTRSYSVKTLSSNNGSLSPGSSTHSSRATPTHQSSSSHSPVAPVSHLPRSQSVESISERQSPMNSSEITLRQTLPSTLHNIAVDNRASYGMTLRPFQCFSPSGFDQMKPSVSHVQGRTLITGSPLYYVPGIQSIWYSGIPVPVTYGSSSQGTVNQSRPSSRSSDQSDMSTMSVNSEERGVS